MSVLNDNCLYLRASLLSFHEDPSKCATKHGRFLEYHNDGLLIVENGKIRAVGDYCSLIERHNIPEDSIDQTYKDKLIMPGFIDTHLHYPQTEMIASFGEQLLAWLEKYTFPTELKFHDKAYAKQIASFFLEELFNNGTTTAMVFPTVHKQSVDALFEAADAKSMRLIAGKVMMDRHAPEQLLDTAEQSYRDSEELIQTWHNKNRLLYAITPRFAPTSTDQQLQMAGTLKQTYPDVYVQTHLSENKAEIDWVKSLFPTANSYLDVYDQHQLVDKKSIFAHAIHLEPDELETLQKKQASVSFCPSSNLFLGSGLFNIRQLKEHNIFIGLGSDVGAGTSFSMLKTLSDGYKVTSLEQNGKDTQPFGAFEAFYQITLGASESLDLADKIGRLAPDYEADFVVIDLAATKLQKLRMDTINAGYAQTDANGSFNLNQEQQLSQLEEALFALMIMGDDRNIVATYVNGAPVYQRK